MAKFGAYLYRNGITPEERAKVAEQQLEKEQKQKEIAQQRVE
ncbi:MAG: hypothetical protein AAF757_21025 [Cyanobacteria bacterium P01_D01_bin.116]